MLRNAARILLLFAGIALNAQLVAAHDSWINKGGYRNAAARVESMVGGSKLRNADLTEATLSTPPRGNWTDESLNAAPGARLNLINLRFARAYRAFLANARMWRVDLEGTYLSEANLHGANLREAVLRTAILDRVQAAGAVMVSADATGANFSGADLRGADLSYGIFENAVLSNAKMAGASLYAVNLRNAQLLRTDLSRADLRVEIVVMSAVVVTGRRAIDGHA